MMDAIDKKFVAIKLLYPSYNNSSGDTYFDTSGNEIAINMDDVNAKIAEIFPAYAENRKAEYDQLNQFEMQFDDDRDSTTTWVDKINEIKGRHPKP